MSIIFYIKMVNLYFLIKFIYVAISLYKKQINTSKNLSLISYLDCLYLLINLFILVLNFIIVEKSKEQKLKI